MYVGGGLGSVPYQAKLFYEFVAEDELLPVSQAICRVFARLGEKRNRARARLKFLVAKLGLEEFRRLVEEERKIIPPDERWSSYLDELRRNRRAADAPTDRRRCRRAAPRACNVAEVSSAGARPTCWRSASPATSMAVVCLPLGDITSRQIRALADDRAQVQRRRPAHHRRAELRPALDRGARPGGAPRRPRRGGPGAARRLDPGRHHRVPGHRHLQARHLVVARARRRAAAPRSRLATSSSTTRSRTSRSRSRAASTRAASTTSPTSASTA